MSIKDGSELWNFGTEKSFIKSQRKLSLIIQNGLVIFIDTFGDINALDISTGRLVWQSQTINEDIYLEVINGKTASLFSSACQVGAMVTSTSNEKIEALKTFGLNFGMSYQLTDDAIDYSSSAYKLGKNIGDDFKQGKVTLPIILAYLRSNDNEKKYWKRSIQDLNQNENDFEKALKIIKKYNCIYDTIKRANHYANIAKDSLGK